MRTRMIWRLLTLLSLATLLIDASAQATAATYRVSEEDRNACIPDVFRFCSQFIPDATQITVCLQQKVPVLSPGCRAVFTRPIRS